MAKGLRDMLIEELRNLGISMSIIKRLVPKRGKGWNSIGTAFQGLIKLLAYRIRVELDLGANIRPKIILNCIRALRGDEDIPDSDVLGELDCSSSDEDSSVEKSSKTSAKTRSQKRKIVPQQSNTVNSHPVEREASPEAIAGPSKVTTKKRKIIVDYDSDSEPEAGPSASAGKRRKQ